MPTSRRACGDIIAEYTNNFADPAVWEKRRIELAHEVRREMRAQDSVTCRSCHDRLRDPADKRARPGRARADARGPHDLHRLPLQSGACAGAADAGVHPRIGDRRRRKSERSRSAP